MEVRDELAGVDPPLAIWLLGTELGFSSELCGSRCYYPLSHLVILLGISKSTQTFATDKVKEL